MEDIDIRKYAGLMRELDLTGLEVTENGATLRLERSFAAAVPAMAPVSPVRPPQAESAATVSNDSVTEIRSPMVGVFYSSPKDNEPPFVKAGDAVKKGDVLCIIEAMKLMNEIESEFDGVVEAVLVKNEEVVEYGQPLFRIR